MDDSYADARITRCSPTRGPRTACEPPAGSATAAARLPVIVLDALPVAAPGRRVWRRTGQPGLRHLHLGLDRPPKGVLVEHRSLVNYIRWAAREAGLDASARLALFASLAFDLAGCAIFLPLPTGAPSPGPRGDRRHAPRVLLARGATAMKIRRRTWS